MARVRRTEVDTDVGQSARLALAEAAMLVAAGDEPAAADLLERAIAIHGLDSGINRRAWRRGLALTYVLVPSARDRWDAAELRGHVAEARTLARAVVALRDGAGCAGLGARGADEVRRRLRDLDLSDMSRVRAGLHHRFAVELALGLEAAGRPEGATLLEALGPRGREAMRAEAATRTHRAKLAKSLLAAVPAPPADRTEIAVLGPLALARNGEPVTDGDLRRERVRALLAFLVGHRTTSRAAIMAALWPDLDERAAANNLRVTMTYLLRVLEPWRSAREPAYHIRVDGQAVTLVTSDWLRIDVDRFNEHVTPRREGRGRRHTVAGARAQPRRRRALPGRGARGRRRRRLDRARARALPAPLRGRGDPGRRAAGRPGRRGRRGTRGPACDRGRPLGRGRLRRAGLGGTGPRRPLGRPPHPRPRRWPPWPTSTSSRPRRPAACAAASGAERAKRIDALSRPEPPAPPSPSRRSRTVQSIGRLSSPGGQVVRSDVADGIAQFALASGSEAPRSRRWAGGDHERTEASDR